VEYKDFSVAAAWSKSQNNTMGSEYLRSEAGCNRRVEFFMPHDPIIQPYHMRSWLHIYLAILCFGSFLQVGLHSGFPLFTSHELQFNAVSYRVKASVTLYISCPRCSSWTTGLSHRTSTILIQNLQYQKACHSIPVLRVLVFAQHCKS